RHHEAFGLNTWNPNSLEPEPRACMILNRFSRNLGIMYASPSCQIIFGIEPDQVTGKPFLLFIRADDLAVFVEQVDIAKASNAVTHMRFWFQSPKVRHEIPCEAMLFGAADGMVAILRKCKPFYRKKLITQEGEWQYSNRRNYTEANSGYQSHHYNNDSSGSYSSTLTEYEGDFAYSSPSVSPNSTTSSSTAGTYTHSSPASGAQSHYRKNHSHHHQPTATSGSYILRALPIGSINSIRNLDKEHNRIRPLTSLNQEVESDREAQAKTLPAEYLLRKHHIQQVEEVDDDDEPTLEQEFERMVDI
ncbi:hypothetical protein BGZ94_006642, partial [Podila epigama]